MIKKAAIAITASIVCGTLAGYLCMKDKSAAQTSPTENTQPPQYATTRAPEEYIPSFSPVVVPEELKQHFTLNPKASQVITGNSGTILLIPDNAFTDKDGNAVEGKVKLELVEGIAMQDIVAMNLSTVSDQGILETGGMIYIGAQSESGEELQLAEGKIIEAEIPSVNKKPGMQLWEGQQNDDGTVLWVNPEPIVESLTEVPVSSLADSAAPSQAEANNTQVMATSYVVEAFDGFGIARQKPIIGEKGVWYRDSLYRWRNDSVIIPADKPAQVVASYSGNTNRFDVVNFADPKFENTNIATAEFRSRLPYIKQSCDARIAHCYADNPTRALWKSDAAAADSLEKAGCPLADVFREFAKMKQSNIDPQDPNTAAALDAAREQAIINYSKKMAASRAMYAPFKFGMKTMGWRNIDCLMKTANPVGVAVTIGNKPSGQNITVTLIMPGRGVCMMGWPLQNGDYSFTGGTPAFPYGEVAYVLAKAGEGDNFTYALQQFTFGNTPVVLADLQPGTKEEMELAMGNVPEQPKSESVEIIDDWYTRSIKSGGCICSAWSNAQ